MAKARKEAASGPQVEQNGSWFTITDAEGTEHKVQGEDARDEKLRELGYETESESDEGSTGTSGDSGNDEGGNEGPDTKEAYDTPPEAGSTDDRPTTEEEIEKAKAEKKAEAIPPGVRKKQPGAESVQEQESEDDEMPEPESARLAREDDEREKELAELSPEEAHARQARRATDAGMARTRRPVVPKVKSDTALPQTEADKDVPDDLDEDAVRPATGAEDEPETAIDARGYQTSNDGRGPFSAESLAEGYELPEDEERERREKLEGMNPEERQQFLIEEAEESEESKPEVARKPALTAALDTTVEANTTLRSGVPTGPVHHPDSVIGNAPDGTEPGNTLLGWSAQQKTPKLLGAEAAGSDEE